MKYRHADGVNNDSPRFAVQNFFLENKGNCNDHISSMSMNSLFGEFSEYRGENYINTKLSFLLGDEWYFDG